MPPHLTYSSFPFSLRQGGEPQIVQVVQQGEPTPYKAEWGRRQRSKQHEHRLIPRAWQPHERVTRQPLQPRFSPSGRQPADAARHFVRVCARLRQRHMGEQQPAPPADLRFLRLPRCAVSTAIPRFRLPLAGGGSVPPVAPRPARSRYGARPRRVDGAETHVPQRRYSRGAAKFGRIAQQCGTLCPSQAAAPAARTRRADCGQRQYCAQPASVPPRRAAVWLGAGFQAACQRRAATGRV